MYTGFFPTIQIIPIDKNKKKLSERIIIKGTASRIYPAHPSSRGVKL